MLEWFYLQEGLAVYLLLALGLIGGGIGLPIPEDIPLLAAGIAVNAGAARPIPTFLVCYAAILLGDCLIFFVGRKFGPAVFRHKRFKSRFARNGIRRVKVSLERRSLLMIFVARHLFYLRTVTFLTCGAVRMHPRRFILADAAAALVSVPLMMTLGYAAAEHYTTVTKAIHRAEVLSILLVLALVCYFWYRYHKRSRDHSKNEV
ncbi:MAG: DedA family protein [Deltaproteobacteria bacterium]|nr:DedA family protein [Deltaproteobacteria bacterium]